MRLPKLPFKLWGKKKDAKTETTTTTPNGQQELNDNNQKLNDNNDVKPDYDVKPPTKK